MTIRKIALIVGGVYGLSGSLRAKTVAQKDRREILKDFEGSFEIEKTNAENELKTLVSDHEQYICDQDKVISDNENVIDINTGLLATANAQIKKYQSKIAANQEAMNLKKVQMKDTEDDQAELKATWLKEKNTFDKFSQDQYGNLLPAFTSAAQVLFDYTSQNKRSANADGKKRFCSCIRRRHFWR